MDYPSKLDVPKSTVITLIMKDQFSNLRYSVFDIKIFECNGFWFERTVAC